MNVILGILGLIASIIVGLYVGVWVMFVGGVIGFLKVILGLLAGKLLVGTLAFSIVKVLLATFVGYVSFFVMAVPSVALIVSNK